MDTAAEPHIIRFYRYQDALTGHWRQTRHRMSPADADAFFTSTKGRYGEASKWEPIEEGRMEVQPNTYLGPGLTNAPPAKPGRIPAAELRAIWERNRNPDVRVLLWEIARLQEIARHAQAVTLLADPTSISPELEHQVNWLTSLLANEPSLSEHPLKLSPAEEREANRIARERR